MSVFGVILIRIFPAFSRIRAEYGEITRTEYISEFSPNVGKCGKNVDQNNSKYKHFLRSVYLTVIYVKNMQQYNDLKPSTIISI